jgi:hypothetical protein
LDKIDLNGSLQLLDILRERLKRFSASHTYPVYKKLQNDANNPFFPNVGLDLNNEIERIVNTEWMSARVIKDFDYGLGGLKNMLFYIPYGKHRLFFVIDISNVILVNYLTENKLGELGGNETLSIYDICLVGPNKRYVEEIYHLGETFYATNTNKSFLNFGESFGESKWEVSDNLNILLWNDFRNYINNKDCFGTHDILQIGDILINCDFTKGVNEHFHYTSKLWVD